MTCHEAETLIDLYACGACSPDEVVAVEAHLAGCATCRAISAQAADLGAMLDWSAREPAARSRLRSAVAREARPRTMEPSSRRLASVASLLLVALSLTWLSFAPLGEVAPAHGTLRVSADTAVVAVEIARPGFAVRDEPVEARGDLPVALRNDSGRAVEVALSEARLQVTLRGAGRLLGAGRLEPATLRLRPGETGRVVLRGLRASRPGEYEVEATALVPTAGGELRLSVGPANVRLR